MVDSSRFPSPKLDRTCNCEKSSEHVLLGVWLSRCNWLSSLVTATGAFVTLAAMHSVEFATAIEPLRALERAVACNLALQLPAVSCEVCLERYIPMSKARFNVSSDHHIAALTWRRKAALQGE
jgi:hypothetical protein